jgi:hypothetical protein
MPSNLARLRRIIAVSAIVLVTVLIITCGSLGTFVSLTQKTVILRLPNADVQVMYSPSTSYRQMEAPEEIVVGWQTPSGTWDCLGNPGIRLGDVEVIYFACAHYN